MKKVITSIISLLTITSLLVGAPKKDIVDTAVEAGSFKTLVTAVQKAGLVDTLKVKVLLPCSHQLMRHLQIFETLKNLLKPENKDKLQMVTYHVDKNT